MLRARGSARAKNPLKVLKRLFKVVFKGHLPVFIFVIFCIICTALATVYASNFMETLIDGYITPLVNNPNPDFQPLVFALVKYAIVIAVFLVLPSYMIQRTMIKVSQGAILDIRCKMFKKLESLPLSYFDTHPHGEIMSRFSNDTDTPDGGKAPLFFDPSAYAFEPKPGSPLLNSGNPEENIGAYKGTGRTE